MISSELSFYVQYNTKLALKNFLMCCKIREIVCSIYPLSLKSGKGNKETRKKMWFSQQPKELKP